MPDETLNIPTGGGTPKETEVDPNQKCESGNLQVALTAMANEFGAAAAMRTRRMDQLAEDSASMWAVALTSPTVLAGMGYQAAAGHMPPRQTELSVAPQKAT